MKRSFYTCIQIWEKMRIIKTLLLYLLLMTLGCNKVNKYERIDESDTPNNTISVCETENTENDLIKKKLKGKVKSVKKHFFSLTEKFGELVIDESSLVNVEHLKFNEKGKLIFQEILLGDRSSSKQIFKYDDKGYIIEKKLYKYLEIENTIRYKYDIKGNETEIKYYDEVGVITSKGHKTYDNNGNCIVSDYYDKDGILTSKYKNKFDINGNCIEVNGYKGDGSLSYESKREYNSKNQIIEITINDLDDKSLTNKSTYKYDTEGNNIETKGYDLNGDLKYHFIYKYDNMGNQVEERSNNFTTIRKYEYDEKNNWVRRDLSGFSETLTEREIEYYE
jgi:hypothetical protein